MFRNFKNTKIEAYKTNTIENYNHKTKDLKNSKYKIF